MIPGKTYQWPPPYFKKLHFSFIKKKKKNKVNRFQNTWIWISVLRTDFLFLKMLPSWCRMPLWMSSHESIISSQWTVSAYHPATDNIGALQATAALPFSQMPTTQWSLTRDAIVLLLDKDVLGDLQLLGPVCSLEARGCYLGWSTMHLQPSQL